MEQIPRIIWEGDFGNDYTKRNMKLMSRGKFWQILNKYPIHNCLEVGCNWGRNLLDIETVTPVSCKGIDVNAKALSEGRARGLNVDYGMGEDIPYFNKTHDLVFTVGVMIHMRTPELVRTMKEMTRVSCKFVLFAEYLGDDEEVPYHGERQALIKRRFSDIYEALFPDAKLVDTGKLFKEDGFDDVNYWMYDISNCASENAKQEDARKGFIKNIRCSHAGAFVKSSEFVSDGGLHSGRNWPWGWKPTYQRGLPGYRN